MNYALWGTSVFTARLLEVLIERGMPPALLIANPDKPAGRNKTPKPGAAAEAARMKGIPVAQPEKLDAAFLRRLAARDLALSVVAAYGRILKKPFLEAARFGTVGVHPSLLPRHRGPAPIQTAILVGDEATGVSIYRLDEGVDRGPIISKRSMPVGSHTTETLGDELAKLGGRLLADLLPSLSNGMAPGTPQDESQATYTKKFTSADAFTDCLTEDPFAIERKIRALNPEPGVWTYGKLLPVPFPGLGPEKRVKLLTAKQERNAVFLTRIHVEGKRPFALPKPILLGAPIGPVKQ